MDLEASVSDFASHQNNTGRVLERGQQMGCGQIGCRDQSRTTGGPPIDRAHRPRLSCAAPVRVRPQSSLDPDHEPCGVGPLHRRPDHLLARCQPTSPSTVRTLRSVGKPLLIATYDQHPPTAAEAAVWFGSVLRSGVSSILSVRFAWCWPPGPMPSRLAGGK